MGGPFGAKPEAALRALDLFQHLEGALGSAGEHALEHLGKATTLERVAPDTFTFCHGDLTVCGMKTMHYTASAGLPGRFAICKAT